MVVSGDNLEITYADKTKKESKKEPDAALTTTLANYGVSKDALDKVSIDIERQSSWQFWLTAWRPSWRRFFSSRFSSGTSRGR